MSQELRDSLEKMIVQHLIGEQEPFPRYYRCSKLDFGELNVLRVWWKEGWNTRWMRLEPLPAEVQEQLDALLKGAHGET